MVDSTKVYLCNQNLKVSTSINILWHGCNIAALYIQPDVMVQNTVVPQETMDEVNGVLRILCNLIMYQGGTHHLLKITKISNNKEIW